MVRYNGIAGEERDWAYNAGGKPFKYEITPKQANLLSRLQHPIGLTRRELKKSELELIAKIPQELWHETIYGEYKATVRAQLALYDLLK